MLLPPVICNSHSTFRTHLSASGFFRSAPQKQPLPDGEMSRGYAVRGGGSQVFSSDLCASVRQRDSFIPQMDACEPASVLLFPRSLFDSVASALLAHGTQIALDCCGSYCPHSWKILNNEAPVK